jgi:hypothetical protein
MKWSGVELPYQLQWIGGSWLSDCDMRCRFLAARSTPITQRLGAGASKTLLTAPLQSARTTFERPSNSRCMRLSWITFAIAPRGWRGPRPVNVAAFKLLSAWLRKGCIVRTPIGSASTAYSIEIVPRVTTRLMFCRLRRRRVLQITPCRARLTDVCKE